MKAHLTPFCQRPLLAYFGAIWIFLKSSFRRQWAREQSAHILVPDGPNWRLARSTLSPGGSGQVHIDWPDVANAKSNQSALAKAPFLTLLSAGDAVMTSCTLPLCAFEQLPSAIKTRAEQWFTGGSDQEAITYAIWGKSAAGWNIGLIAGRAASLTRQEQWQAARGYWPDRCVPESLALLAYHLKHGGDLPEALLMHVDPHRTLFLVIFDSRIAAQQTVLGDFSKFGAPTKAAQEQARQSAKRLQMRLAHLCASQRAQEPLTPEWRLIGLSERALWQSLDIALAPVAGAKPGRNEPLSNEDALLPIAEGAFFMQCEGMWLEADFPTRHFFPNPLFRARLALATRAVLALAVALAATSFGASFAKARAVQAVTCAEFGDLAQIVGQDLMAGREMADFSRGTPLAQKWKRFEKMRYSDQRLHLMRWRAQLEPVVDEVNAAALGAVFVWLADCAKAPLSQGLQIEQLLFERCGKIKGGVSSHLVLKAKAPQREILEQFSEQIKGTLFSIVGQRAIEEKRVGKRLHLKLPLDRELVKSLSAHARKGGL